MTMYTFQMPYFIIRYVFFVPLRVLRVFVVKFKN